MALEPMLVAVMSKVVSDTLPALIRARRANKAPTTLSVTRPDGTKQVLAIDSITLRELEHILRDAEIVGEEAEAIDEAQPEPEDQVEANHELQLEQRARVIEVGATALAIDSQEVFRKARERVDLVFKVRLGALVLVVAILIASLVVVILATSSGRNGLALAGGVAGIGDLVTAWVYKPLEKVRDTINDTQRLDLIHLSAQQQLEACDEADLAARRECLKAVWAETLENLRVLAT